MLNVQIVGVAIRLFAIWLGTWGLRALLPFSIYNQAGVTTEARFYTLGVSVAMFLVALGLWLFPLSVANKLIPGSASADYPTLSAELLQRTGASLLGLWVLSNAVPESAYAIILFSTSPSTIEGPFFYPMIVRMVLNLAIGVWLLFGARGLFGLVQLARRDGSKHIVQD
jgi:hypothetical protein